MKEKLYYLLKKTKASPIDILLEKGFSIIRKKSFNFFQKLNDNFFGSYSNKNWSNYQLSSYLDTKHIIYKVDEKIKTFLVNKFINHEFELLGSGWVKVDYDKKVNGLNSKSYKDNIKSHLDTINKSNFDTSSKIYSLIDKNYVSIDWQKDFKSGFRWDTKSWYKNQRNSILGADIKIPWELGRLQHLPQLALLSIRYNSPDKFLKEFKNQILDFISLNPPRFGVQWACTMDVGIRAANMVLAYDIFSQIDNNFILDSSFKSIFTNSIYDHGLFIINNLEYKTTLTSNHYLSNIAGLLFISSYLYGTEEIAIWLAFSIQEIISEMKKQFYEDGVNFESSTSYHRLSSEILIYSTAVILGLPPKKVESLKKYDYSKWRKTPKLKCLKDQEYKIINNKIILPDWFIERLYLAGKFTHDITKPNFEIPQIGDNDSGRFFKFSPNGNLLTVKQAKRKYKNLENYSADENNLYWDENILNHQTLLSAFYGLFNVNLFKTNFVIESKIVQLLANNRKLRLNTSNLFSNLIAKKSNNKKFNDLRFKSKKIIHVPLKTGKSLIDGLNFITYKNGGYYIFKSKRLFLLVYAGPNGQNGNGGHAHNDKLSFELSIDGKDLFVDPGTYLYTPFPDIRNKFRSTIVHNTLIVDNEEQNEWISGRYGLFNMKNQSHCYVLNYGNNFIDLGLTFRDVIQRRKFIINKDSIVIENYSNKPFHENYNNFKLYSNGYGKLLR